MLNIDDVLDELGELGRFQITTYLLICLPILFSGANSLCYVFTAGIPNYRCYVPLCDQNSSNYMTDWLEYAIPNDLTDNATYKPAQCLRYKYAGNGMVDCVRESFTTETEPCSEWIFDDERTIVNDWGLTCIENQVKLSFIGNSHFIGIFIGSFVFGVLSDRYGRKNMFLISIFIMCVAGVAHVLSTNYYMFLVIACVHAIGTAGVYPLGFVLGVELVGRKKREFTGVVLNFFYAIGEALLGVVAWYTKDWTLIQIIVSAPCIIFLIYTCFIPESLRWLIAKKKNREATGIIYHAAKINKVVLSKSVVDSFQETSQLDSVNSESTNMKPTIRKILKSRILVVRYLIIFFIWSANAFIYYGLSLNSTNMIGNKYLNFILVCLIEIPGYFLSWIAILKVGRKYSLMAGLLLCAVNCAISIFIDEKLSWLIITLFLIGKLSITASFGIIYVYTAELFPTIVRSGGVATASTFARLGAFLAPFIPLLSFYFKFLPMTLFAVIAGLAGIAAIKLPETLNKKLPETYEDAVNI